VVSVISLSLIYLMSLIFEKLKDKSISLNKSETAESLKE
jgi:hypothetical protein